MYGDDGEIWKITTKNEMYDCTCIFYVCEMTGCVCFEYINNEWVHITKKLTNWLVTDHILYGNSVFG